MSRQIFFMLMFLLLAVPLCAVSSPFDVEKPSLKDTYIITSDNNDLSDSIIEQTSTAQLQFDSIQKFLIELGYSRERVMQDVVEQDDEYFSRYYAKLLNAQYYIADWKTQIDSRGGTGYVSPTIQVEIPRSFLGGIISYNSSRNLAVKYYPGRANSVGMVRTGAGHYYEAAMTLLDVALNIVTGRENLWFDMHRRNSSTFLKYHD